MTNPDTRIGFPRPIDNYQLRSLSRHLSFHGDYMVKLDLTTKVSIGTLALGRPKSLDHVSQKIDRERVSGLLTNRQSNTALRFDVTDEWDNETRVGYTGFNFNLPPPSQIYREDGSLIDDNLGVIKDVRQLTERYFVEHPGSSVQAQTLK